MLKSIAFFLIVFALGLAGLLVVSGDLGRWFSPKPAPDAKEASEEPVPEAAPEKSGAPLEPNRVKVPVFDVARGRLEYTFEGILDDDDIRKIQDIQQLDTVRLRDGQLRVPIYDDLVKGLPAGETENKPKLFILEFAEAQYQAFRKPGAAGDRKQEREREVVTLSGGRDGGIGRADDGSTFRFQELTFEIDRKPETENQFTIRSRKPVSIQLGHLRLESPSGLDGAVLKNKGLQKLSFLPPVWTYIDPRAARLFAMGTAGGAFAEPVGTGIAGPGSPKGPEKEGPAREPSKVAITCEGPLNLSLETDPATIRFEKNIFIYPIAGLLPQEGRAPPPPETTYFHCQLLQIDVDSKTNPPTPQRAVATWDGARVEAHHLGSRVEGDRLVWTLPPLKKAESAGGAKPEAQEKAQEKAGGAGSQGQKPEYGEAVLTGKPRLSGDQGWLESQDILFKLDEDRILLRGGLTGVFRAAASEGIDPKTGRARGPKKDAGGAQRPDERKAGEKTGTKAAGAARGGFQEDWDFKADEGEIVFQPVPTVADGRAKADPAGGRALSRLIARSAKEDGLEIRSRPDGQYHLKGNRLEFDARSRTITMEGTPESPPRFQDDLNHGSARSIVIRVDENLVALRGGVGIEIEDFEGLSARQGLGLNPSAPQGEGKDRPDAGKAKAAGDGKGSPAPGPSPPGAPRAGEPKEPKGTRALPESPTGPVELSAEELDLRFDSGQLLGIEARCMTEGGEGSCPEKPVVLQSLSPRSRYRLTGWRLSWDAAGQVALVRGPHPEERPPAPAKPQEPELVFEGGKVAAEELRFDRKNWKADLTGRVTLHSGFELCAGKAEILFNENFRPNEKVDCGSAKELQRVRKIHAWAPENGWIEFSSQSQRYRGRAGEATWDGESQELHLFGDESQELALFDGAKESTLTARDILYRCTTRTVVFSGEVRGELRVDSAAAAKPGGPDPAGARSSGAAGAEEVALSKAAAKPSSKSPGAKDGKDGKAPEILTFNFETSRMEAAVRDAKGGLEPVSLDAFEKVLLTNVRYGIQLRGDEFHYEHQSRELVIFSREGRPQKLTRTHLPVPPAEGAAPADTGLVKVDQIEAREIRLIWQPAEIPAGAKPPSVDKVEKVLVRFKDDVNATYFAPAQKDILQAPEGSGPREEWKMRSDHLALRLVPVKDSSRVVQLALAEGNVIFKSGDYMAIANEAVYEEGQKKLLLRGTPQKPARLFFDAKTQPIAQPEIYISNLGEQKDPIYGVNQKPSPDPPGLQELRRPEPAR